MAASSSSDLRIWLVTKASLHERVATRVLALLEAEDVYTVPDLLHLTTMPHWRDVPFATLTRARLDAAAVRARAELVVGDTNEPRQAANFAAESTNMMNLTRVDGGPPDEVRDIALAHFGQRAPKLIAAMRRSERLVGTLHGVRLQLSLQSVPGAVCGARAPTAGGGRLVGLDVAVLDEVPRS